MYAFNEILYLLIPELFAQFIKDLVDTEHANERFK